jgi:micrococcal nuclease
VPSTCTLVPRRRLGARSLLLAALVLLGPSACGGSSGPSPGAAGRPGAARVTRVVDGDTIDVDLGGHRERVRLLGIDTPETHHPTKPVQCYGPEAAAHTADLLPEGTGVRLERDEQERDDYGRLLAYVYRLADGLFVNGSLVADGYATTLSIRPNVVHAPDLAAAEGRARAAGLGLWGACGGPGRPAVP